VATILSSSELLNYQPLITATAGTILTRKWIETVEQRIPLITNNYFVSDTIQVNCIATFNATAGTIVIDQTSWEEFGFKNADDILIYRSLRNDGYFHVDTFATATATIATTYSVIDESYSTNDGPAILFAYVKWPIDIKDIASEMIYFDAELRSKMTPGVRSKSLGPWSESYSGDTGKFGYPVEILGKLDNYIIARLN
jgi:hypothetical protein